MKVDTDGEEKDRRIKDTSVFMAVVGESTNPVKWKLYMHPYDHGVWKKRIEYPLQTGRELISTGNMLIPTRRKPNLRRCYRRWQAS